MKGAARRGNHHKQGRHPRFPNSTGDRDRCHRVGTLWSLFIYTLTGTLLINRRRTVDRGQGGLIRLEPEGTGVRPTSAGPVAITAFAEPWRQTAAESQSIGLNDL